MVPQSAHLGGDPTVLVAAVFPKVLMGVNYHLAGFHWSKKAMSACFAEPVALRDLRKSNVATILSGTWRLRCQLNANCDARHGSRIQIWRDGGKP